MAAPSETDLTPRQDYETRVIAASQAATGTALASYSTEQAIDTLANYSKWNQQVVTYSFPLATPDNQPADYIGNSRYGTLRTFTPEQAAAARLAIELWDDLIPIDFVDAGNDPDADTRFFNSTIDNTAGGAPAGPGTAGDIWVYNYDDSPAATHNGRDWSVGTFYFGYWMLHEIGHTLGLSHAGGYPGPGWNGLNYLQDSVVYTLMSYNSNSDTQLTWHADMATPMVHDIAAIQFYYGADMSTRTGDTVYGFNTTLAGQFPYDFSAMLAQEGYVAPLTVWDAGGIDTLDFSGFSDDAAIDLAEGGYSDAGGQQMAFGIAYGTVIENAIAGSGNDSVFGNSADNVLTGNQGRDVLRGFAGNDTLHGDRADGSVQDAAAVPLIVFNQSFDAATQGGGYEDHSLDQTSAFAMPTTAVTFEMLVRLDQNLTAYDTLVAYANGGEWDDQQFTLRVSPYGTDWDIKIAGQTLRTNITDASFVTDTAFRLSISWDSASGTVKIYRDGALLQEATLAQGASIGANGNLWLFSGWDATVRGALGDIRVWDHVRTGQQIAADKWISYASPTGIDGLVANWQATPGSGTLSDIVGTPGVAALVADNVTAENPLRFVTADFTGNFDDVLFGGEGNDVLDGGQGSDEMIGGAGNDTFVVDRASDLVIEAAGGGTDTVRSATISIDLGLYANVEVGMLTGSLAGLSITGTGNVDYLHGSTSSAGNTLSGLGGNDIYYVGAGDTVVEAAGQGTQDTIIANAAVRLDTMSTAIGVEHVALLGAADLTAVGHNTFNTLTGNSGANYLAGLGGNDTVNGGAGNDRIQGNDGKDILTGGTGNDQFIYTFIADSGGTQPRRDVITDFSQIAGNDDWIDLALTDANGALAGNQAFTWIGTAAFSGAAGELRYFQDVANNRTIIEGNVRVDAASPGAEFSIEIRGLCLLTAGANNTFDIIL